MRERHSKAFEDIGYTGTIDNDKPKRKSKRVGTAAAKEKFAAMHSSIEIARHMEALSR